MTVTVGINRLLWTLKTRTTTRTGFSRYKVVRACTSVIWREIVIVVAIQRPGLDNVIVTETSHQMLEVLSF